jgi:hypothetical protein
MSAAYIESDSMAPLRLVTTEDQIAASAHVAPLDMQLLCSVVIALMQDVRRLKKKVADLEGRERI